HRQGRAALCQAAAAHRHRAQYRGDPVGLDAPTHYLHDEISTDKRDPHVNAHGTLYGSPEESTDLIPTLDPVKNARGSVKAFPRDPETPTTKDNEIPAPSPYWGMEKVWDSQTNIHNPMFDANGKVCLTARVRGSDNPAFCKAGSQHPSAKYLPPKGRGAIWPSMTPQPRNTPRSTLAIQRI